MTVARRLVCALALVAALSSMAAPAAAQNMPQASQVNGMPLSTPDLAVGTVTVRVFRERIGNNVPNVKVTLEAPKGPREATTDAEGRAEFTGLTPGDAVRVHADVDGEALQSQNFNIAPEGGTRVALIAGIAAASAREAAEAAEAAKQPARPGVVVLGNQSRVIIEFQDDKLTVFYILDIVNAARTPIGEIFRRTWTGELLATWLHSRVRRAIALTGGFGIERRTHFLDSDYPLTSFDTTGAFGSPTFPSVILAAAFGNAQRPAFSISPEDGIQVNVTLRDRFNSTGTRSGRPCSATSASVPARSRSSEPYCSRG